jgi:hypothetical protein
MPGVSAMGAVTCGDINSRDWAFACAAVITTKADAIAHAPQRRIVGKPHPNMANFLDLNHGNFMPPRLKRPLWPSY